MSHLRQTIDRIWLVHQAWNIEIAIALIQLVRFAHGPRRCYVLHGHRHPKFERMKARARYVNGRPPAIHRAI